MARGTWGTTGDIHPVRVNLIWSMGLTRAQTGFYLRRLGTVLADAQEAAQHVYDNFGVHFKNILLPTDMLVGVDAVDITTGEGGTVSPAGVVGTLTGTALPDFVSVNVAFKGELRRKYGQGGGRWPMRSEAFTDGNLLNTAGTTAVQSVADVLADQYVDTGLTSDWRMINVHGVLPSRVATPSRPARPEVPASWYDVTSIRISTRLSSLDSRKAGNGS